MSVLEDYQITEMGELFPVETIEDTLDEDLVSLTPQQEAVLQFIVDNPEEEYVTLQNTFSMPDSLVMDLVKRYGTPTEQIEEMRDLTKRMKEDG